MKKPQQQIDWHSVQLELDTVMSANFKTTQNVRRFFHLHVGTEIVFDRPYRQWLQQNRGATLGEAIQEYRRRVRLVG